ncbi:MAG TPA: Crp/Fnr family transcriptional regulator [Thermoleophilaceae bacterium]
MSPAGREFLKLLTDADRRDLEAIGRRQAAQRGDVLLARGEVGDKVLVVDSGRVKVSVTTTTGREVVLTFRGPGSLLGDQSLVDESPRSATVTAVEPVEVLCVASSAFRGYLATHPDVALAMLATLSARLRESDRRLAEYAAADTLGRICARLVELCEMQGNLDGASAVQITLPITQEELAGWTGASIEATAKALRALRDLGWVTTGRRALEVQDLAALRGRAP